MRARLLLASVALIGLVAFAPIPFPKPKKAATTLDGAWQQRTLGGKPVAQNARGGLTIVIGQGRWAFVRGGGLRNPAKRTEYFIVSNPNVRPATFDLRKAVADPMPYGKGIWRIEGDELHIAYSWSATRPTAFEPKKGTSVFFMTLRRVRK